MVSIPIEGRWSVRVLTEQDVDHALRFLRRDPLINVFLIARILEERLSAPGQIIDVQHNGETICIASLGTNVVLGVAPHEREDRKFAAVSVVADRILTRMVPVRAIICTAELVEMLWRGLQSRLDPPTVVRMNQPIYALKGKVDDELRTCRFATVRDLDQLVPACAAMHREEVGIDPLERDAAGYRERIRELVARKQSIVRMERGRISFKCEFSAVTPEAVQLMGVWTAPEFRRQGIGRQAMSEVCGHIVRQGRTVTLFVNDFNESAIQLYESLGFDRIGMNRALIW